MSAAARRRGSGGAALAVLVAAASLAALPATAGARDGGALARPAAAPDVRLPLRTHGRWIVDRTGRRVKLASVNWYGAESPDLVPGGLDRRPVSAIVDLIAAGGFNAVRLPWSNEMVETNPVVAAEHVAANPALRGRRALDVLDAVIRALGKRKLMVILDNHRGRADWCCDQAHGDGFWYSAAHPEAAWIADWRTMARRYRDFPNVVAAELRNEIRADPALAPGPTIPTWGDGDPLSDWRAAATRGGNAVLGVDPDLLVIVGGTSFQGDLTGVAERPVRLGVAHRVVYAPHNYRWFNHGSQLSDYRAFRRKLRRRWGYILEAGRPYTAPLILTEFGTCTLPPDRCNPLDAVYLRFITRYLRETDMEWAYWPLNGTESTGYGRQPGTVEIYGLLDAGWSDYGNRTVLRALRSIQPARLGPRRR